MKEWKILMLGLDETGKSMILYEIKGEKLMLLVLLQLQPRVMRDCLESGKEAALLRLNFLTGFNVETLQYQNIRFFVWDVGGHGDIRQLWKSYFQGIQGNITALQLKKVCGPQECCCEKKM